MFEIVTDSCQIISYIKYADTEGFAGVPLTTVLASLDPPDKLVLINTIKNTFRVYSIAGLNEYQERLRKADQEGLKPWCVEVYKKLYLDDLIKKNRSKLESEIDDTHGTTNVMLSSFLGGAGAAAAQAATNVHPLLAAGIGFFSGYLMHTAIGQYQKSLIDDLSIQRANEYIAQNPSEMLAYVEEKTNAYLASRCKNDEKVLNSRIARLINVLHCLGDTSLKEVMPQPEKIPFRTL